MKTKKRKNAFFKKYINGTKGVISLFLAILMVPFVSIAGALVNAGRINSAVAIFDEALCNASNSVLGTYDEFLRNRFGLMAISQDTSDGGTKYGVISEKYSAENLLNDMFTYYMRQNVGTLSNTYTNMTLDATGLYPLADTEILLPAVLDAAKYTVPVKTSIDWLSLDDMVDKLTSGLKIFSSIADVGSGVTGSVTAVDTLMEKKDALCEKIDEVNTAESDYNTAYDSFASAASSFNTLVGYINNTYSSLNYWQGEVNRLKNANNTLLTTIETLEEEIEALKNDEDENGNPIDHEEEIKEKEEELEKIEKENKTVVEEYDTAVANRNAAQSEYNGYVSQFEGKRTAVVTAKDNYYDAIIALRDAVASSGDAVEDFQDAAASLVSQGVSTVGNVVSATYTISTEAKKDQIQEMKNENQNYAYQQTLAGYEDNSTYVTHYYNLQQENNTAIGNIQDEINNQKNESTLVKEAVSAANETNSTLSNFANTSRREEYQKIYDDLSALAVNVSNRTVPSGYSTMSYSDLYYSLDLPVDADDVDDVIESIEEDIVNNIGWGVAKAIVSFVKALFEISVFSDPDLAANIDTTLYSSNGGLPSEIDRSLYPLTSEYDAEDAALSQQYKDILNSYSAADIYPDSTNMGNLFETLMSYIDQLLNLVTNFKLGNLSEIGTICNNIISLLINCELSKLAADMMTTVYSKMLLVGYISYNTANRTTYTGKALTGASYALPEKTINDGYCFSGAETEYIYAGGMSEKDNQKTTFNSMWLVRILLDIAPVAMDSTVASLASSLGSVTFGIGAVLVYLLFFLAEGFVSTIILANGGKVPMVKSFIYLSPGGVLKLLEALFSLKLSAAAKQSVYEGASSCVTTMSSDAEIPSYEAYKQVEKENSENLLNLFTWDYTKTLQLLLLFCRSSDTMIKRLADIIQMEASYHAATDGVASYGFNLDNSYTYLRVSGSFDTTLFMQLTDETGLTSQERIIYKGY